MEHQNGTLMAASYVASVSILDLKILNGKC